jgi:hypothetical protein
LEGIGGPQCRRYLDRIAVAGLVLELRNAAGGRARYPESGRCLIERILAVRGLFHCYRSLRIDHSTPSSRFSIPLPNSTLLTESVKRSGVERREFNGRRGS